MLSTSERCEAMRRSTSPPRSAQSGTCWLPSAAITTPTICALHPGVAHVGYVPADRILGLSKLARVVQLFARDLQVQERLTKQVADWLQQNLAPKGVGVVLEAEHLCMSVRGVRASGSRTVTSAVHGLLRDDAACRQEFFALAGSHR